MALGSQFLGDFHGVCNTEGRCLDSVSPFSLHILLHVYVNDM